MTYSNSIYSIILINFVKNLSNPKILLPIMKKITLFTAFLVSICSYGQSISGFVKNPSFEDGPVGTIAQYQTLNDWKLGGANMTGASASIQSTDVHAGDGSNALEVTSEYAGSGGEWNVRLMNTTYPFDADGINPIDITVSFWAKTTDLDPTDQNSNGDFRILIKDTGSANFPDATNRVILETDTWIYVTKTFTFDPATDYNLSLYLEFGKVNGTTQIDGITASVTGGATLDPTSEPVVVTQSGFILNPSFEDGSAGPLVRNAVLDNWKLEGANAAGDNSAIIQTTNVHDGDGSNALEVTNLASAGEWNNKVTSTAYPFDGDGINPIDVTISFWAKTTDTDPISGNANGDLKLIVRDAVSASDKSNRAILATDGWVFITKTFSFPATTNYSLSLSIQFGRLEGVTQIDGITSSVSGGATLATQDILINDLNIFIYPNPVKNILSYNSEGIKNIEVYNLLGQKLIEEKAVGSLNTSAFSKGSYLLKLLGENGSVSTVRFIKE